MAPLRGAGRPAARLHRHHLRRAGPARAPLPRRAGVPAQLGECGEPGHRLGRGPSRGRSGRIALAGYSMGGGLAPRAAAFEPRIAALICIDGIYDIGQSYTERLGLGADTERRLTAGTDPDLDAALAQLAHTSSQVRWSFRQGMWSFGVATPRRSWPPAW